MALALKRQWLFDLGVACADRRRVLMPYLHGVDAPQFRAFWEATTSLRAQFALPPVVRTL